MGRAACSALANCRSRFQRGKLQLQHHIPSIWQQNESVAPTWDGRAASNHFAHDTVPHSPTARAFLLALVQGKNHARSDAATWLKRYSGLLRLHAALLSPAEKFLLRPASNGSPSSSLQLRSTFIFSRSRPAPRTPFTFYTTGTATRCTVQATPLYSLIPVPQFTLS